MIESEGLTPLTDYLALFGGWPMTLDRWSESSFDWKSLTASTLSIYNMNLLISVYNELDERDTDKSSIHVRSSLVVSF